MKNLCYTFAFLAIVATSCGSSKESNSEKKEITSVKTATVIKENYAVPIITSGTITSGKQTNLSFKMSGVIAKMFVEEGQKVRSGQLLAILDQTEINAQLAQASGETARAEREFLRMLSLYKENAATLEEFENSKTRYEVLKQNVKVSGFNKKFAAIYANQSGQVITKSANEGEMVNPGTLVYTINSTNENDWVIMVGVADKDWARLRIGNLAVIQTDAYPDQVLTAAVSEIAGSADPLTGTFKIRLKFASSKLKLANGLTAKIKISPSDRRIYTFIPIEALTEVNQNSGYVFTPSHDNLSATKRKVTIAFSDGARTAVSEGLANVNQVIVGGASYLQDGSLIKINH